MMENKILGIASVPYQNWGDLYTPKEALKTGTIFKELNKPFFAADQGLDPIVEQTPQGSSPNAFQKEDRERLMTELNEVSFVLDDLTLYLDTHAEDLNALNLYTETSKKRDEIKKEFSRRYYPLTRDCIIEIGADQNGF